MAIFHCQMSVVGRATGRSAVASAAYRAGERLENARDGQVHDYTRREGIEHAEIVLPVGVNAAWVQDRTTLWNAAEAAEKRVDARVAREFVVALPHELPAEERLALARSFAQDLADRTGAAVDFAIHAPHPAGDMRNHHAHLLMTTRRVEANGLGAKTPMEMSNTQLLSRGLPSTQAQLVEVRRSWEGLANVALAQEGLDIRIDHRSHAERGLTIEPTQHMGVQATAVQRRGGEVERARLDPVAAERNAEVIRERPEEVLALITNEKSVFDRRDIARTLHRYLDDDAHGFRNAFASVMASPALVELQPERTDVVTGEVQAARYSTREMVAIERGLAEAAERLHGTHEHGVDRRHVERALARQDAAIQQSTGDAAAGLSGEQRAAIEHVTGREGIAAVVGFAGAGKSTMLAAAREAWEAQGYTVHGAALSGKAAEGLEESSGIASRTLASWSRGWDDGRGQLGRGDVLVIDEAGMVGSRQLARFVGEAEARGAKLVLVGDHEQLQAIGAGAPFRAVAERIGHAELTDIRRQRTDWQREASVAFATHRTADGLSAYREHGAIEFAADRDGTRGAIVRDYLADREARPEGTRVAMAHRRVDVRALNADIRSALQDRGDLARGEAAAERIYATNDGARAFAPGDRIVFLENSRQLGVKNGMLGTVEQAEEGHLVARLDGAGRDGEERRVNVPVGEYQAIDHGYATTIHKTQGATVDRSFVLASGTMDRHLTYVAMTRHRDEARLYAAQDEFAGQRRVRQGSEADRSASPAYRSLEARLSRSGAKETVLDYPREEGARPEAPRAASEAARAFAERRGIAAAFGIASEITVGRTPERTEPAAERVLHTDHARATPQVPEAALDRAAPIATDRSRRSLFDGLKLSGRPAAAREHEAGAHATALERDRLAERVRPLSGYEQAVDRFARAYSAAARHVAEDLPLLEAQKKALSDAGQGLDEARPGAHALLRSALQHDPAAAQAMAHLTGRERVGQLAAGLERERAALADPNVRAERFVQRWQDLAAQRAALSGWQHEAARGKVEGQMRGLSEALERDPQAELAVSQRRQELGIATSSAARESESVARDLQRSLARERSQGMQM